MKQIPSQFIQQQENMICQRINKLIQIHRPGTTKVFTKFHDLYLSVSKSTSDYLTNWWMEIIKRNCVTVSYCTVWACIRLLNNNIITLPFSFRHHCWGHSHLVWQNWSVQCWRSDWGWSTQYEHRSYTFWKCRKNDHNIKRELTYKSNENTASAQFRRSETSWLKIEKG